MKPLRFIPTLSALVASLVIILPATSFAGKKKVTIYRDLDGDGHYNKKTFNVHKKHYGSYHSGHGHDYYGGRSYGSYYRPYPSYYGYSPYYRPYIGPTLSFSYSRSFTPSSRAYYSDDLAVDVQRELRRRGYYRGSIDGDVGPGTRAAIRAYQHQRGLAVTGRIDRSLLRALGIG